jgi:predicted hydrocarbon binding protein
MPGTFDWRQIGDIEAARPNLGSMMHVGFYRLTTFSVKNVLDNQLGREKADAIYKQAGIDAGKQVYSQYFKGVSKVTDLVKTLAKLFNQFNVGIFRIESTDEEQGLFEFSVLEDLDCSGTPVEGEPKCKFDEGFIAGILESYLGRKVAVAEEECWGTGGKVCRFKASVEK